MRWSIVRVIWVRELRDQLRDRRTMFMIVVLPILLYPIAGLGLLQLAAGFLGRNQVVGVVGTDNLPPWPPRQPRWTAGSVAGVLGLSAPLPAAPLAPVGQGVAAVALDLQYYDPPLFLKDSDRLHLADSDAPADKIAERLVILPLEGRAPADDSTGQLLHRIDRRVLDEKQVDVLLVVPNNFAQKLATNGRPTLYVLNRPGDEHSRAAETQLYNALLRWERRLKDARLLRLGLSPEFDDPIDIRDPEKSKPAPRRAAEGLFETLGKIFPFILVMWSLAGALYPAVDLCAGEKERGTMETLLISPASREEIVWGKFLTIWVFSAATALLNLFSIALTSWQFSRHLPAGLFRPAPLLWGLVLLLPLSAFFSAVCLAVGAYARSSKEGQYYLMPLFLITMPLIFLTLAPGVELNAFYAMVPVTGVALLLQRLMAAGLPGPDLWAYFIPVLAPMIIYGWLALRWAIDQFQREEVLFREAERLDLGLWLRHLLRDKEPLPNAGEAMFCFGLILGMQWLATGLTGNVLFHGSLGPLLNYYVVRYLALVAAPPLLMALVLTTQPLKGLSLRWPPWWAWPASAVLAVLLLPPLTALTMLILEQFPAIQQGLRARSGLEVGQNSAIGGLTQAAGWQLLLVIGVLPAVTEELAFRGFILAGLRRRFRPVMALIVSSFLFALYQTNVFQCVPHFLLGLVLGILVLYTGSVLPAILFHLVWNLLLLSPALLPGAMDRLQPALEGSGGLVTSVKVLVVFGGLALAIPLLWLVCYLGADQAARMENGQATPGVPPTPGPAQPPAEVA